MDTYRVVTLLPSTKSKLTPFWDFTFLFFIRCSLIVIFPGGELVVVF